MDGKTANPSRLITTSFFTGLGGEGILLMASSKSQLNILKKGRLNGLTQRVQPILSSLSLT